MNLETLEIRRVRFDLIFLFKIFHNTIDIDFNKYFAMNLAKKNYDTRGHNLMLKQPKFSGSHFKDNFFTTRIIPTWNSLPKTIVEAQDTSKFKLELKNFDLNTIYTSKV